MVTRRDGKVACGQQSNCRSSLAATSMRTHRASEVAEVD
jgi:hypothetical protein